MISNQLLNHFKLKLTSIIYKIATTPYLLIAAALIKTNKKFCEDYTDVIKEIDKEKADLDIDYLNSLIMAEDHRYRIHTGIDFISITRAIKSTFIDKNFQGASTIEQQLVRVVTYRYERTIERKVREQLLSVLVSRNRKKICIANTYLHIAYFGWDLKGYHSLNKNINKYNNIDSKRFIVSHLKYPKPKHNNKDWEQKITSRVSYISERTKKHSGYLFK